MSVINMLVKNEDLQIQSLWSAFSKHSMDQLNDIILYFSSSKNLIECSREWSQIMKYKSGRRRMCICGKYNYDSVYIRNNINSNIIRIGESAPKYDSSFIPREEICEECKTNPISKDQLSTVTICDQCCGNKQKTSFPLDEFLFKLPIIQEEQKIEPAGDEILFNESPPPTGDENPTKENSWSIVVQKSKPKPKNVQNTLKCIDCGENDPNMRGADRFCKDCYDIRKRRQVYIKCNTKTPTYHGLCGKCSK